MKNVKLEAMKIISRVAAHEARKAANTSCVTLTYQPKLSEDVKKLRKF
jgi:cyclic lactone autoinducer peptide